MWNVLLFFLYFFSFSLCLRRAGGPDCWCPFSREAAVLAEVAPRPFLVPVGGFFLSQVCLFFNHPLWILSLLLSYNRTKPLNLLSSFSEAVFLHPAWTSYLWKCNEAWSPCRVIGVLPTHTGGLPTVGHEKPSKLYSWIPWCLRVSS